MRAATSSYDTRALRARMANMYVKLTPPPNPPPPLEKSTDYDKFKAYFTLLCTLWIRRLKFASGSISVLLTSYTANIIMLLLCGFVRSQVDGDFGVEYDIWKIASPEDMGMAVS